MGRACDARPCTPVAWVLAGVCALLGGAGCADEVDATLVASLGCELPGNMDLLRVRGRGDFPIGVERLLTGGTTNLGEPPEGTVAFTLEGRMADRTEAIGRTATLSGKELPVYFAPPDALCAVNSTIGFREFAGAAAGEGGDVVLAGGRDEFGNLVDELVVWRDVDSVALPLTNLTFPATGLTVNAIGDRQFAVVGGAGANRAAFSYLVVDAGAGEGEDPVVGLFNIPEPEASRGRSYHGAAVLADTRLLVAGGCANGGQDALGACADPGTNTMGTTVVFDPRDPDDHVAGPPLIVARWGHELHVARDGTVFAIGGRDGAGDGVFLVEKWAPGLNEWRQHGADIGALADPEDAIVGAAILEGGIVVVALSDGRMLWLNEDPGGVFDFNAFGQVDPMAPPLRRRQLLALPGERVLADSLILPVAGLGQTPSQAIDLTIPPPGTTRPGPRVGATMVALRDGTALYAGGRDPETGAPEQPFLMRLRPGLDGPDEDVPDISLLVLGSFVVNNPARVLIDLDDSGNPQALRMNHADLAKDIPDVRAHVRGFRSARFRLDASMSVSGSARPHFVFQHGATRALSLRIELTPEGSPAGVTAFFRSRSGAVLEFSCSGTGPSLIGGPVLRAEYGSGVRLFAADVEVATCPVPDELAGLPVTAGLGVSDTGSLTVRGLRVSRI